jgi:hypothetical protein
MSDELKGIMKGSILYGMLSDVHENNIKIYPFVFLDGVKEAEISYNIPTMGESTARASVIYTIKFNNGFPAGNVKQQVSNLKKAVQILMQHDASIKVFNEQGKEIGE